MSEMTFNQETVPAQVPETETPRSTLSALRPVFTAVVAVFCVAMSLALLLSVFLGTGSAGSGTQSAVMDVSIIDRFDMFVTNEISSALDGVVTVKKEYWLSDNDLVAPEPNPACYGKAASPEELQWLLEDAAYLLDRQDTVFGMDTEVWSREMIQYYYDETILVITWKQPIDNCIYTISEIKIADPSQFRRFLAGGEFGSGEQYVTTEMAESVNAVVASSGDFYQFRRCGIMVYNGEINRLDSSDVDTCFIDDNGDLLFAYRGEIRDMETAQKYVDEHNVRFSLAFGPVMIDNGEVCVPNSYRIGEINEPHSRAAICQVDELHYLMVTLNGEGDNPDMDTVKQFAVRLQEMGVQKAYALDGGQTAVIAMQGETVNRVDFNTQRKISDIIYFATALPEGE